MKINFQNMCSLRKISCGLIFSMAISLVACGSDNDEEGGHNHTESRSIFSDFTTENPFIRDLEKFAVEKGWS